MRTMKQNPEGFWHEIRVTGKTEKIEKVFELLAQFNQKGENELALKKFEPTINPGENGVGIDGENHQIRLDFVQWGVEEPELNRIEELMNELGEKQPNFFVRTFPKELVVNKTVHLSFHRTLEEIFVPYDFYWFGGGNLPVDAIFDRNIKQLFERFQTIFKSFGLTYECFSKPSLGSEFELIPTYGENEVVEDYVKLKNESGETVLCFKRLTEKQWYPDYKCRNSICFIGANEFDDTKAKVLKVIEKMKEKVLGFQSVVDVKLDENKKSDPTLEKIELSDEEIPF